MAERRQFLGGAAAGGLLAAALAAPQARAADSMPSAWQQIRDTGTLRIGAAISEAWCFKDTTASSKPGGVKVGDTVWRGLSPAIGEKLAAALGAKLAMIDVTWGNAVAGLQANQFDVIFGFDGTPERAAAVDFIPQPFFWVGTALLGKPELDFSSWDAVSRAKLRIAVPAGTSMEYEIGKRAPGAEMLRFPGYSEAIAAFQAGRADALTASITTATLLSARLPGTVARMPKPTALFPISGALRPELDQRLRNFMVTAIGYYADNEVIQQAVLDMYAFRGVDITKVEPVVNR